jgi:probable F420-dependent oxidoreductase
VSYVREVAMKFGFVLPIWRLAVADAETLAVSAEELGIDAIFTPDHILAPPATTHNYGPNWPDPFALLAYLAGRTRRIQLGASAIVLPYRHPLVTAKAAATVDQVSGGRFILGIGVGWDEEEFRNLGLPFHERGKVSDEYLRIIKAAWAADEPSFEGRYFRFAGATFSPRPLQRPHPPIWAGGSPGSVSRASVRRVAESCDAWHPLALSLDDLERGVGMVRELARELGRHDEIRFAPRNLLNLTDGAGSSGHGSFEGSPDEVAADIRRAGSIGIDYLVFDFPESDVPGMLRLMESFVNRVKPSCP